MNSFSVPLTFKLYRFLKVLQTDLKNNVISDYRLNDAKYIWEFFSHISSRYRKR